MKPYLLIKLSSYRNGMTGKALEGGKDAREKNYTPVCKKTDLTKVGKRKILTTPQLKTIPAEFCSGVVNGLPREDPCTCRK